MLGEYVADGLQLGQHVVQVRVVVDEPGELLGHCGHVLQQDIHFLAALVDRREENLGIDQQAIDLLAVIVQNAGHFVGLRQQIFELLVRLPMVSENRATPSRAALELGPAGIEGLGQHVQRISDGGEVPLAGAWSNRERVIELVRRGALFQRKRCSDPSGLPTRVDLHHPLTQDGAGAGMDNLLLSPMRYPEG